MASVDSDIVDTCDVGALSGEPRSAKLSFTADELATLNVPEDAGEWAFGLARLLARMPAGWPASLDVGPGWYSLLCELDDALFDLLGEYEVQQVKEKYGSLRFYWSAGPPPCCVALSAVSPEPSRDNTIESTSVAWLAWSDTVQAHKMSSEHLAAAEDMSHKRRIADQLVSDAESLSARICEVTGDPGVLMTTFAHGGGWYKTLDPTAAPDNFSTIVPSIPDAPALAARLGDDAIAWQVAYEHQNAVLSDLAVVTQRLVDALRESRHDVIKLTAQ